MKIVNIEELRAYCSWASGEYRRLEAESKKNHSDYECGLHVGMSSAFEAVKEMLEGKIAVPRLPDAGKHLFTEYLDEPLEE